MLLYYLSNCLYYFTIYYTMDYFISMKFTGTYYIIHSLNNMLLVYLTYNDIINTIMDFPNFITYPINYEAMIMTYSLHFYHMVKYFKKLRFDDWLHHILMVGIALPISGFVKAGSLMGYSLFFLTGLPGGIDYFLLFLVRNNYMESINEKKINTYLNLWIRGPGCISHAVLTLISYFIIKDIITKIETIFLFIIGCLVFWNGIYFMNQVIINNYIVTNSIKNK
jgi:hypothetical protein